MCVKSEELKTINHVAILMMATKMMMLCNSAEDALQTHDLRRESVMFLITWLAVLCIANSKLDTTHLISRHGRRWALAAVVSRQKIYRESETRISHFQFRPTSFLGESKFSQFHSSSRCATFSLASQLTLSFCVQRVFFLNHRIPLTLCCLVFHFVSHRSKILLFMVIRRGAPFNWSPFKSSPKSSFLIAN